MPNQMERMMSRVEADNMPEDGRLEIIERQWQDKMFLLHLPGQENNLPSNIDIETVVLDFGAEKEDSGDRQTVLVVGGVGESVEVMKPFLQELALAGKRVIGISLPGNGDSSDAGVAWRVDNKTKKDKTDFADYSQLINTVLNNLRQEKNRLGIEDIGDKVSVVGHSLGGAVAADFAKRNVEAVDNLVLVAPAGYREGMVIPGVRIPPKVFYKFSLSHAKETWLKRINEGIFGGEEELPPVVKNTWINNFAKKQGGPKMDDVDKETRLIQRFWEGMVTAKGHLVDDVRQVADNNVPVHILAGEKDKLFPPADYKKYFGEFGDKIDLEVLLGRRHYDIIENSRAMTQPILEKLK